MEWVTEFLGNYAFPIVMCMMLFWKMNQQDKDHKEESGEFTKAIENNTIALTTLTEVVREIEGK